MAHPPHQKTGHQRRREREAKRLLRDRKIYAKLRHIAAEGEQRHARFDEPIEPLSVY